MCVFPSDPFSLNWMDGRIVWMLVKVLIKRLSGDDIWKYLGKLTEAQRSMLDDRFKWKVNFSVLLFALFSCIFSSLSFLIELLTNLFQAREMDKRREGRPGEARAALRRSVRDNGYLIA